MAFTARIWNSDSSGNSPVMSGLENGLDDLSHQVEAANNFGICVASARFDQGELVSGVLTTAKHGAALTAELAGLPNSQLQIKVTAAVRVSNWGSATTFNATTTVSSFTTAAPGGTQNATITTPSLGNAGGIPQVTTSASLWTNAVTELAQLLDMAARVDRAGAGDPTAWQSWHAVWIRVV